MNEYFFAMYKWIAQEWARHVLAQPPRDWCIIDTETTGTGAADEVVQIGIIDGDGMILMDQLVCPSVDISLSASRVHNITYETVAEAPAFFEILPGIQEAWEGRTVIMYNAAFDYRLLCQSAAAWGAKLRHDFSQIQCAMEMYSLFAGHWNEKYQSFRWQKLGHGGTHGAVDDCLATLKALKEMASGV